MNWHTQLRTYGYAHLPGLTPTSLALAAREAIDVDLHDNYDSERQLEYDNRSYCPGLLGAPPIMDLLIRSPIIEIIDEALGLDNVEWGEAQIAIRRSRNFPREIPPEPHLDGFASGLNGKSSVPAQRLEGFTQSFVTLLLSAPYDAEKRSSFIVSRSRNGRGV